MKKSKKMNLILLSGSILAGFIIFLRQFILYDIPEYFSFGEELGELLFNLCVGYLVTYWFYYLTIYREEKKKSEFAFKFVKTRVNEIAHSLDSLLTSIYKEQDETFYFFYPEIHYFKTEIYSGSDTGLDFSLSRLDLQSHYFKSEHDPILSWKWWEKFHKVTLNAIRLIGEIELYSENLDSEIDQLIKELLIDNFLKSMSNMNLSRINKIDFQAHSMCEFIVLVERLREKLN